jgi:rubrerythrin
MSNATKEPINGLGEFLAHAITLENESAERYHELADSMETHNNMEIAKLFRKLAHFGEIHAHEVAHHAEGMELPQIPPWDYKWSNPEGPESGHQEDAHYLMDVRQTLQMALHNEERGRDFYAEVAATSGNEEVSKLANEFALEEQEHVDILKKWMVNLADPDTAPLDDLDPPNMPE